MNQVICATGEVCDTYAGYLGSQHWDNIRSAFYSSEYYHGKCERCKTEETKTEIQLHHKTYERLGNELLTDFAALCRRCHNVTHYKRPKYRFGPKKGSSETRWRFKSSTIYELFGDIHNGDLKRLLYQHGLQRRAYHPDSQFYRPEDCRKIGSIWKSLSQEQKSLVIQKGYRLCDVGDFLGASKIVTFDS